MKFKDLFCIFIIENDKFYIKSYVFKTFKLQLPADFGGLQTPQTVDLETIKRQPFKWTQKFDWTFKLITLLKPLLEL